MLADYKKVHFVGIGGIGVSALAQWFLVQGAKMSGSNLSKEPMLEIMRRRGARIFAGPHCAKNIPPNTEFVVYTLAAPRDNPERREARRRKIPEMSYPEAVGELTKEKFAIAVCGAHGKSTTASMAALMLARAGFDPTIILGTRLKELGNSNFRYGKSKYFVLEADEWHGAFWNYHPQIAILTNIDREHLDFYKTLSGVKTGFKKFLMNLPRTGLIIANKDDPHARKLADSLPRLRMFYSAKSGDAAAIRRVIKIPGEHNISNALAVLALAKYLKIPKHKALGAIGEYKGSWRRFEYKGRLNGAKLYDDYGHHPTEIMATLEAAKSVTPADGRLWCVFQPHHYQRLKLLFRDFTCAFGNADRALILPVYAVAGREKTYGFCANSERLAHAVAKNGVSANFAPSFGATAKILKKELGRRDVCVLMGAGDIVKIHKFLQK